MSNSVIHNWVDATANHADELTNNLREFDRLEVMAYGFKSPEDVVADSVRLSNNAKTWLVDGKVALICGVAQSTIIGSATPWALTTPIVEEHPYLFLRGSKFIVGEWKRDFKHLHNYVDSRYKKSIRWLEWLGFKIDDPVPVGKYGILFNPISMVS